MADSPTLRPTADAAAVHPSPDVPEHKPPLLRVVRGNPTPEELAALIAVVAARGSGGEPEAAPVRPLWGRPVLRTPLFPSPGAWRASTLPR